MPEPQPEPFDPSSPGREVLIRVDATQTTAARVWTGDLRGDRARAHAGILFVSGVDGGFIEPADGIYTRLADRYAARGVAAAFVQYRAPGDLEPSIDDALAGAAWLRRQGAQRLGIVGWSFGGAVITNSAPKVPESVTVIGFSPQSLYAEPVTLFSRQSLLLFHSRADENVPFEWGAPVIYEEAPASIRKELVVLEDADHALDGERAAIEPKVTSWLERELLR